MPAPSIIVPFAPSVEELKALLQALANDPGSDFLRALDRDVSHIDVLAQVQGVRITAVEVDASALRVRYDVDYHLFDGCRGLDARGRYKGQARGVSTEAGWCFEPFVLPGS